VQKANARQHLLPAYQNLYKKAVGSLELFPSLITAADVIEFRAGWEKVWGSTTTRQKAQQNIRSFLRTCCRENLNDLLAALKTIRLSKEDKERLEPKPFAEKEIKALFAQIPKTFPSEKIATATVTRRFAKVKGAIDLGSPETPKRRRYRVLRIPKSVVEKFLLARGCLLTSRHRRETRNASPRPQPYFTQLGDDVVQQLAMMRKQRGAKAQTTLDKIVERARLLTFVPESQWSDVVWFDEEEDL
jgi:hypothetical protein